MLSNLINVDGYVFKRVGNENCFIANSGLGTCVFMSNCELKMDGIEDDLSFVRAARLRIEDFLECLDRFSKVPDVEGRPFSNHA